MLTLCIKKSDLNKDDLQSTDLFKAFFVEKDEDNEELIQVIPYCIIKYGETWLCYKRSGSESRLVNQLSAGFGGHVEEGERVIDACIRELREEIHLTVRENSLNFLGLIYDDSTPVNKVHLGVVYYLDASDFALYRKNPSDEIKYLYTLSYSTIAEGCETWTKLAFDLYFKDKVRSTLYKNLFDIIKVKIKNICYKYISKDWEIRFGYDGLQFLHKMNAVHFEVDGDFNLVTGLVDPEIIPLIQRDLQDMVNRDLLDLF